MCLICQKDSVDTLLIHPCLCRYLCPCPCLSARLSCVLVCSLPVYSGRQCTTSRIHCRCALAGLTQGEGQQRSFYFHHVSIFHLHSSAPTFFLSREVSRGSFTLLTVKSTFTYPRYSRSPMPLGYGVRKYPRSRLYRDSNPIPNHRKFQDYTEPPGQPGAI